MSCLVNRHEVELVLLFLYLSSDLVPSTSPILFLFLLPSDVAREKECSVLVHCLAGISRSVTVTVAYLMYFKSLSLNDAFEHLRQIRPNISPNFSFMGQLLDFERMLQLARSRCSCQRLSCIPCHRCFRDVTDSMTSENSNSIVLPDVVLTSP